MTIHKCSNLNKVFSQNLCRWRGLFTGLPPFNVLFLHSTCYSSIQRAISPFNVLFLHSTCYFSIQRAIPPFNVLFLHSTCYSSIRNAISFRRTLYSVKSWLNSTCTVARQCQDSACSLCHVQQYKQLENVKDTDKSDRLQCQ